MILDEIKAKVSNLPKGAIFVTANQRRINAIADFTKVFNIASIGIKKDNNLYFLIQGPGTEKIKIKELRILAKTICRKHEFYLSDNVFDKMLENVKKLP